MVLVLCSLYLCYAKCNCAAFNVMDHGYGIWATFFFVQALVLYMSANNMHFFNRNFYRRALWKLFCGVDYCGTRISLFPIRCLVYWSVSISVGRNLVFLFNIITTSCGFLFVYYIFLFLNKCKYKILDFKTGIQSKMTSAIKTFYRSIPKKKKK